MKNCVHCNWGIVIKSGELNIRFIALLKGHSVSALSRAPLSPDAADLGVAYFGGLQTDADTNGEKGSGAWTFLAQPHLDVVIFAVWDRGPLAYPHDALPLPCLSLIIHSPFYNPSPVCLPSSAASWRLECTGVDFEL